MKTLATVVTERGQVSVPAEIRRGMGLAPGARLCWEMLDERRCNVFVQGAAPRKGARAMLGFARSFRAPKRTAAWMRELRAGEES